MPRSTKEDRVKHQVSVSLGKPSLRLRLEAYYKLIAPDQIEDTAAWRARYDQIWEKFGGTEAGELKLAKKLAKKYGSAVRLQLTTTDATIDGTTSASKDSKPSALAATTSQQQKQQHDEAWFELNEKERSSGDLCFTSSSFDPVATLAAHPQNVVGANSSWMEKCPNTLLDRVDQFRQYLPRTDPQYIEISRKRQKPASTEEASTTTKKMKPLGSFAAIASHHETGPLSVLHKAFVQRDRVRVLIRYVNGIRGTLTGTLMAFDKHFNLLMRDVEEVYSRRQATMDNNDDDDMDDNNRRSNVEVEIQRRIEGLASFNNSRHFKSKSGGESRSHSASAVPTWSCRQRSLRQIMVRGDNVVSVYRADMEQSAWPVTSKSPKETIYRKQSVKRLQVPPEARIGTPGSLVYAAASAAGRRRHNQRRPSPPMGRKDDFKSYDSNRGR